MPLVETMARLQPKRLLLLLLVVLGVSDVLSQGSNSTRVSNRSCSPTSDTGEFSYILPGTSFSIESEDEHLLLKFELEGPFNVAFDLRNGKVIDPTKLLFSNISLPTTATLMTEVASIPLLLVRGTVSKEELKFEAAYWQPRGGEQESLTAQGAGRRHLIEVSGDTCALALHAESAVQVPQPSLVALGTGVLGFGAKAAAQFEEEERGAVVIESLSRAANEVVKKTDQPNTFQVYQSVDQGQSNLNTSLNCIQTYYTEFRAGRCFDVNQIGEFPSQCKEWATAVLKGKDEQPSLFTCYCDALKVVLSIEDDDDESCEGEDYKLNFIDGYIKWLEGQQQEGQLTGQQPSSTNALLIQNPLYFAQNAIINLDFNFWAAYVMHQQAIEIAKAISDDDDDDIDDDDIDDWEDDAEKMLKGTAKSYNITTDVIIVNQARNFTFGMTRNGCAKCSNVRSVSSESNTTAYSEYLFNEAPVVSSYPDFVAVNMWLVETRDGSIGPGAAFMPLRNTKPPATYHINDGNVEYRVGYDEEEVTSVMASEGENGCTWFWARPTTAPPGHVTTGWAIRQLYYPEGKSLGGDCSSYHILYIDLMVSRYFVAPNGDVSLSHITSVESPTLNLTNGVNVQPLNVGNDDDDVSGSGVDYFMLYGGDSKFLLDDSKSSPPSPAGYILGAAFYRIGDRLGVSYQAVPYLPQTAAEKPTPLNG